jgi:hypothetical protein
MGEKKGVYRILVGKHEGNRPLGRLRCRWKDNIDGSSGSEMLGNRLDRAGSGQGQVLDTCECGNETSGSIKSGEFFD